MQTILINYADDNFRRRQRFNAYTAITKGGVDRCDMYRADDLDHDFVRRNRFLLSMSRGAGLWLWKPYIILHALERAEDGDAIFYCDSGSEILQDLGPLVDVCSGLKHGVLGFGLGTGFPERCWTKRDTFVVMDCDQPRFHDTPQMKGGNLVFVKCASSIDFVRQWLSLVCQVRLVSDLPSVCDEPEFSDFRAHRHDQSIFSLLYKKHGYRSCSDMTGVQVDEFVRNHASLEPSLKRLWPTFVEPSMYFNVGRPGR